MLDGHSTPTVNERLVVRDERFGSLVHDIPNSVMYVLNETGTIVLKSCDGKRSTDEITSMLKKKYGCDNHALSQIRKFIEELSDAGILVTDGKDKTRQATSSMPSFNPMFSFESNPLSHLTLSAPIVLYWEITNVCNLKCLHCYKNASEVMQKGELSTEEIKKVINQLARQKVFWLAITGGEPLMKKDIFEILRYASSKKIQLMLSTNGTLMDEEKAKRLKEAGVMSIQVSIDGIGTAHDAFRGKEGTFERAVNAVKLLIDAGIPDVTIATVATKRNLEQIPKIVALAVSLGATRYRIITLMPTGRAKTNMKKLWLSDDEKRRLRTLLLGISAKYRDVIRVSQEERSFSLLNDPPAGANVPIGCAASRSICKISPEGDVYPCSFFDDKRTAAGSLKKKTFKSIWKGAKIFRLLRTMDHVDGKCSRCKRLNACGGGCRAAAYNLHGSLYAEDPDCWAVIR